MVGYKLLSRRKDGTIGPLFIDKRLVLPIGEWMDAKKGIHKKGYAYRPGWHVLARPEAPHLSKRNRVWAKVEFEDYQEFTRPAAQGGLWYLAQHMRIVELLPYEEVQPMVPMCWKYASQIVRESDTADS